ncbi:MAG: flagellin [Planctomycetota bacterium]
MGLRINSNINSMTALSNLRSNDVTQRNSLERLSTGLRINRASDDPSGLVISEKLRAQITSLNQSLENTQNDINLINTAEAALSEIGDVLVDMRSSVIFALNTGFATGEQINAEQDKINQSLVAIDRIAQSTRFASRGLLNGDSDFIVEQQHSDAFDDLAVRSVRMSPSTSLQTFSVNISQLAGRATLVTNFEAGANDTITQLSAGGDASDFVTLRVRGGSGSADLLMGNGSTISDLVNAVNQNSSATGVFASSFRPMALDSGSTEYVISGAASGIQMNGNGEDLVFGVEVGGGPNQTLIINSGVGDDIVDAAELQAALATVDANFEVFAKDGDLVIRNRNSSFNMTGAQDVRTYTLTANQISTMFFADEGGSGAGAFGEGTAIGVDIDGDGATGAGETLASFANAGGLGIDDPTDTELLLGGLRGLGIFGGADVAAHQDADGNIVLIDTTGSLMGSAGNSVGFVNNGGTDDILSAATNGFQQVTSFNNDLGKFGVQDANSKSGQDESISFINFSIPGDFVTQSGDLQIPTSAYSGTDLNIQLIDANNPSTAPLSLAIAEVGGQITLAEIQTALDTANAGTDDSRTQYQAYFDHVGGLTIVDRFGGNFTLSEDGADTDLQSVLGKASSASTSNSNRIALFSTEFGTDQVISLEDVSSPTSDLSMLDQLNGGLSITADGRDGYGALSGTSNTFEGLAGNKIQGIGKDAKGNISGLAFTGSGFEVSFVTSTLDVQFTFGEHFGAAGEAGSRADASSFGFSESAATSGALVKNSLYSGQQLPNGYLDSLEFAVRQNFQGGPTNISGMRFQIRETNNATDSLMLGIRQISTATLGQDLTPEIGDKSSTSFSSRFPGGALNTLRTGSGNDLATNASNALEVVDRAIDQVTNLRSFLGSVSADTLQRNLNSVGVAVENLTGAQSFIRDLDFAEETTNFTKSQIMFQASTSVLSAANSIPQAVLSLLTGI